MENKIIIFIAATVLVIAIILALTLPHLLRQNGSVAKKPETGGENKRRAK